MAVVGRFVPSWSTVLVGGLAAALHSKHPSPYLKALRRVVTLILLLNWRSLPGVWHIDLFGLIPILHAKIRLRGLEEVLAVGKDPFDTKIVTKGFVTVDASDWNGHMSNSSYPRALDSARFKWLIEVVGPAMGVEQIWSPLAQTSFWFHKEIPAFQLYEIAVSISSWDDKWIYYVARFTTAPRRGSSKRTLNCVALSRSCFKLRGSRLSIPPSRVLSLSGVGPDRSNWERTLKLRAEKKSSDWLKYGGALVARKNGKLVDVAKELVEGEGKEGWEDDGMEGYEERRKKGLGIVGRFGDVSGWEDL